jgi:NADH-quinone oxidoreductase subunit H
MESSLATWWSGFWPGLFTAFLTFLVFLLVTALLIWAERRVVAFMQDRLGPNRVGPLGIGQTLIDGAKMFFKEDVTPGMVEKVLFTVAPIVAVVVSFMTVAVIPVGGEVTMFGQTFDLVTADLSVGVLWLLAMGSLHVYAVFLAGWASQSPYPLMGGVRASAQMVSYEIAQGLAVASVILYVGSMRVSDVVAFQGTDNGLFPGAPNWLFLPLFPAFAVFVVGMIAETQRPPFDLAEAEEELVAGFHTEYSGLRFGMFMLSEFMGVVIQSAIVVTLFFGGPNGPLFGPGWLQGLLPVLYFLLKTSVFILFFILLRGAEPRMRYDKLMNLGWKVMIPTALVWVVVQAVIVTADRQWDGWADGRMPAAIGLALIMAGFGASILFRRDKTARTEPAISGARPLAPREDVIPVVLPESQHRAIGAVVDDPRDTAPELDTHDSVDQDKVVI